MKIAHVVGTFPPHIGGMGQVAYEECKRLAERGHEVTVFTLKYPNVDYNDKQYPFAVVRMKPIMRLGDGGMIPKVFDMIRGFDVVHLHYPFYGAAEWIWMAKTFNHQKYVLTYHMDARVKGLFKRILQLLYDLLLADSIIRSAKRVITVDRDHLGSADWWNEIRQSRLIEILNSVDTEVFKPRTVRPTELGLPQLEDKKIILFVGNPLPFKRLDWLLRAMCGIADPDAMLVVVSDGYEVEKYKKMAHELNLDRRVYFAGRIETQDQLARFYNAAHCLAVPSNGSAESFSLVALEAQASGCPVIVSDSPGLRRRVDPGVDGLVFQAESMDDLVRSLSQMLAMDAAERRQIGAAGRQKAVELYQWPAHIEKLEELYRMVLNNV